MTAPSANEVTLLLLAWGDGDEAAFQRLVPLVHGELRRLAQWHMHAERAGHTLQATALVNEAYLRLIDVRKVQWQNRTHFFAMSARLMRRILVDFARSRHYQKRGGNAAKVTLDNALEISDEKSDTLISAETESSPVATAPAARTSNPLTFVKQLVFCLVC